MHAFDFAALSRREARLDPHLQLDADGVSLAAQVHDAEAAAALEHARGAGRSRRCHPRDADQIGFVPAIAVRRRRSQRVMHAAQPRTGRERRLAGVVERARAGEGPGLPAVPQKSQRSGVDATPAKAEDHRVEAHRRLGGVLGRGVEDRVIAGRIRSHAQCERPDAVPAGDERPLVKRVSFRRVGDVVPDRESHRLEATGAVVDHDRAKRAIALAHERDSIRRIRRAGPCGAAGGLL
jgi:hypothetical protein